MLKKEKTELLDQLGNNTFGDNLVKFRKERHLTQEQLAENVDVSVRTISRLENGGNTDLLSVIRLAEVLKVSLDMLYQVEKNENLQN